MDAKRGEVENAEEDEKWIIFEGTHHCYILPHNGSANSCFQGVLKKKIDILRNVVVEC